MKTVLRGCLLSLVLGWIAQGYHRGAYGGETAPSGQIVDGKRVVKVEAFRYGYRPDPLVVKQGERVRLLVTATDALHGFSVPELGINRKLPPGQETLIEFTAKQTGAYHICSVYCSPGYGGMKGMLIVE